MTDRKRSDYFEYTANSHPIVVKTKEELDRMRAKAKKERDEQMARIASEAKTNNQNKEQDGTENL